MGQAKIDRTKQYEDEIVNVIINREVKEAVHRINFRRLRRSGIIVSQGSQKDKSGAERSTCQKDSRGD